MKLKVIFATMSSIRLSRQLHLVTTNIYQKRIVHIIIIIIFAVIGIGGGTAYASRNSLPGEPLYRVKNLTDDFRLLTSRSPEEKAKVYLSIANERLAEVEKLQAKGASDDLVAAALESYNQNQQKATRILGEAKSSDEQKKAVEELKQNSENQQKVVKKVLERVPEAVKKTVEKQTEQLKKEADNVVNTSQNNNSSDNSNTNSRVANQPSPTTVPSGFTAPSPTPTQSPTPSSTPTPFSTPTSAPVPADAGLRISDTNQIVVQVAPGTTLDLFNITSAGASKFEFESFSGVSINWFPQSGTISSGQTVRAGIIIGDNVPSGSYSLTGVLKNPDNGAKINIPLVVGVTTKGKITAEVYQHGASHDYIVNNARIRVKTLSGQIVAECMTNSGGRCEVEVEGKQFYDVYTLPPSASYGCGQVTRVEVKPAGLVSGGGRIFDSAEGTTCINES